MCKICKAKKSESLRCIKTKISDLGMYANSCAGFLENFLSGLGNDLIHKGYSIKIAVWSFSSLGNYIINFVIAYFVDGMAQDYGIV